ncbi:MAG: PilZ domain-containing protein [Pseudolabrys sp.]|nr:PilZ domain-containing protein [Pseudolabrys sp.]MDP2294878.1 PilZ domain-containing protein [Pseudolabrys sp.]
MHRDKRRSLRRQMRYNAVLILEGDVQRGCVLSDISDTGARIDVDPTDELPERFTLLLSGNGSPRRRCRVVWRQPTQVGVNFDGRLPTAERTGLVPEARTEFPAEGADATPHKAFD